MGTKKSYPVYLDETAVAQEQIAVSAGVRGCQMILAPQDLILATKAAVCRIATES